MIHLILQDIRKFKETNHAECAARDQKRKGRTEKVNIKYRNALHPEQCKNLLRYINFSRGNRELEMFEAISNEPII